MVDFAKEVFDIFGNKLDVIDKDLEFRKSEVLRWDAELIILNYMKKNDISIHDGIKILEDKINDSANKHINNKNY